MKLILEIEIREGPDLSNTEDYDEEELKEMKERGRGSTVLSVKCDGEEIEPENDSIGRNCGKFFKIPGPDNDDYFTLDLVEWET